MHRCGDIFWAQLYEDMHGGSLQTGFRPVLIVSNDKANQYSPVVTIVPITSKIGKKRLPPMCLLMDVDYDKGVRYW